MERGGEVARRALGAEVLDEGHQPDGGDGDPPGAEVERVVTSPASDRADDRRVVVHGLAHSHEDDIRERALFVTEISAGRQELVDNLGLSQVSVEARFASGAKAASDRTP